MTTSTGPKNGAPPKRGDVWWVAFDPSVGEEIRKTRPALVVSNDQSNSALSRLQVVPFSSKTERILPGEVAVTFRDRPQKALCHQVTTVSRLRVRSRIGRLGRDDLEKVQDGLRVQLAL